MLGEDILLAFNEAHTRKRPQQTYVGINVGTDVGTDVGTEVGTELFERGMQ